MLKQLQITTGRLWVGRLQSANYATRAPQQLYRQFSCAVADLPEIPVVEYDYVKSLRNHPEKYLIDVREPDELTQTGQIPSSINIPLDTVGHALGPDTKETDFTRKFGRPKPSSSTEIVFHCKIGRRSQTAAETARALGYSNVKNYKGSWIDWAAREGLPN